MRICASGQVSKESLCAVFACFFVLLICSVNCSSSSSSSSSSRRRNQMSSHHAPYTMPASHQPPPHTHTHLSSTCCLLDILPSTKGGFVPYRRKWRKAGGIGGKVPGLFRRANRIFRHFGLLFTIHFCKNLERKRSHFPNTTAAEQQQQRCIKRY